MTVSTCWKEMSVRLNYLHIFFIDLCVKKIENQYIFLLFYWLVYTTFIILQLYAYLIFLFKLKIYIFFFKLNL